MMDGCSRIIIVTSDVEDPGAFAAQTPTWSSHNRMPGYEDKLTERELEMLVKWMTNDYFVVPEPKAAETDGEAATAQETK